jgi:hypothetical protein
MNFIRPYKLQSCNARTAASKSRCPPSPPPWAASAQGKPMRWQIDPDTIRAKQALLPPPAGVVTAADVHGCTRERRYSPPPLPWAASAQREPPRQQPNLDVSQAKQAPLPPPCQRCHRRRRPQMPPRAPLTPPTVTLGRARAARATASAA